MPQALAGLNLPHVSRKFYLLRRKILPMLMLTAAITTSGKRRLCASFLAGVVSIVPGHAQERGIVHINGPAERIELRVENASVSQILVELAQKYNVVYKRSPHLSRQLTGRYSGNLNEVLARILDGNNYIIEGDGGSINLLVLAPSGTHGPGPLAQPLAPQAAVPSPGAPGAPASPTPALPGPEVPPLTSFLTEQNEAATASR
jgi:hypothetical protein